MATPEQRKEIAEKLREAKEECNQRDYPWMIEDLIRTLGFLSYEDADDQIFDRLADLIDPTCEDLYSDDKTHAWQFKCSSCGSTLDCMDDNGESTIQLDGVAQGVSYCPHCGARVVEE